MTFRAEWRPEWGVFTQKIYQKMRDAAYNSLLRGGYKIQGDARYMCPVNTGLLRSSITTLGDYSNLTVRIGSNLKYAAPVEFGSRPHTPPFEAIREWAEKKKIPAGAVWMKIRLYGTDPHPYLTPAFTKNLSWIKNDLITSIAKAVK